MKIATALVAALVLAGAATSAMACGAAKQTTAQNQQEQLLPTQDARS